MVLRSAWLDASHSAYELEISYSVSAYTVSVSFAHISRVHQPALDDKCSRL